MLDLLLNRRSIRKYKNIEVEEDKIDILIKAALLSPSSRGIRPWEFIVVTDRSCLETLSRCKKDGSGFLKDAPLGIVVLADRDKSDVWVEDASIASVIIQLTAESLDLGSCWIQIRKREHGDEKMAEDHIREVLAIPENFGIESIISIGYPAEKKSPYDEDGLEYNKIHMQEYNIN